MRGWSPPAELEEYRLIKILGRGGMGTVWLAHDRYLDRPVALKFITEGAHDQDARDRFVTEARAVARLHHPNVVGIHRVGDVDGHPYLVTEYVRGTTLDRLPRPVADDLAGALAIGLARGLAAAHRQGVLHRDVKPGNTMLTEENEVKLLDFGLAQIDRHHEPARREGEIAGTPAFLAPEVWRGDPPTPAADVYALGVTLFQLVTGLLPSQAPTSRKLSPRMGDASVPPVRELRPTFPAALAAVIDRCLSHEPTERPASGEAVREALEIALRATRRPALPEGNPYRSLLPFGPEHRGVFFGRELEIADVIERLRCDAWVVVAGRSGAGKSSLVRAGVMPRVVDDLVLEGDRQSWRAILLVPGARPFQSLVAALAPILGRPEAALATALLEDPGLLARELRAERATATLLVIDQLEELVTLSDRDERQQFMEALGATFALSPALRVVATLRSDFIGHLELVGPIHRELTRGLYVLGPMTPEGLTDAVVGPAAAHEVAFESKAVVEALVAAAAENPGSLPLFEFALAKLWDLRDEERKLIGEDTLARIGGVEGALARHADEILASLSAEGAREARRIFLRLVTASRTRARRLATELGAEETLAILVRGRLITAGETGSFELAHEALIGGWPRLRLWLDEDQAAHQARERLEVAARDWEQLGRPSEALWRGRRIAEIDLLDGAQLYPSERAFAEASRRAESRSRWLRRALLVAAPTLIFGTVLGAQEYNQRVARATAETEVAEGKNRLRRAQRRTGEVNALSDLGIATYNAGDFDLGRELWRRVLLAQGTEESLYEDAMEPANQALGVVAGFAPAKRLAADIHAARVLIAERDRSVRRRATAEKSLRTYDDDGRYRELIDPRGDVHITTEPPGARVQLVEVVDADQDGRFEERFVGELESSPAAARSLRAGSYVATLTKDGHLAVKYPFLVERAATAELHVRLPAEGAIPEGFVYVPSGDSLVGSPDPDLGESWASPMRKVHIASFVIGREEVTFADWLPYLESAKTPAEVHDRILRNFLPLVNGKAVLDMTSQGGPITKQDEPFVYTADWGRVGTQDWRRWPLPYVSLSEAEGYAAWLRATGKLPGARLCTDLEWERAARGADGRPFPHGTRLLPQDASFGETYGLASAYKRFLDQAGSFPASRSVFGVDDLAGSVSEMVVTQFGARRALVKPGAWRSPASLQAAYLAFPLPAAARSLERGFRICATSDG